MNKTGYISGIGGLRAIAIFMVVAYHMKLGFADGGFLGVTVFFVISGFLITRNLMSELDGTGGIALKKFWIKRIKRLYPVILIMVPVVLLISAIVNRVLFTKGCSDLLSTIFGYYNWQQIFADGSYFENAGIPSPFTHCWSLAIETQFYIVFPLLLILLNKFRQKSRNVFLYTVLGIAAASVLLMAVLYDPTGDPSRVYYGTDTRIFSLLFGSALAFLMDSYPAVYGVKTVHKDMIGGASLVALIFMMVAVNGYSSFLYRGGLAVVSVLSAVIIYTVSDEKSLVGWMLGLTPLTVIGDHSYSIYLWHYPVILLISGGIKAAWYVMLAEILVTAAVSALSYRFIEIPARKGMLAKAARAAVRKPKTRRERRKQMRIIKNALSCICAVVIVWAAAGLCVAFVPKQDALDAERLQSSAEKNAAIVEQKKEENEADAVVTAEPTVEVSASGTSEASLENVEETAESTSEASAAQTTDYSALTDEELQNTLKLLLIGDSISLDAYDSFYSVFPNSVMDAEISRYPTRGDDIYLSWVNDSQWSGDGVIFALANNGLLYDALSTLRDAMGSDMPLFLVTAHAPYVEWQDANNAEIRAFVEATPNTYLIDWYATSEGHSEYFYQDETHTNPTGAAVYVECIRSVVLSVFRSLYPAQ